MPTSMRLTVAVSLLLPWSSLHVRAEASFDVTLRLDLVSAEQTLGLYEGRFGNPGQIAALRGSQIALATTALILQQRLDTELLEQSLQAAKFNQDLGEDVFRMREARANVREISRAHGGGRAPEFRPARGPYCSSNSFPPTPA